MVDTQQRQQLSQSKASKKKPSAESAFVTLECDRLRLTCVQQCLYQKKPEIVSLIAIHNFTGSRDTRGGVHSPSSSAGLLIPNTSVGICSSLNGFLKTLLGVNYSTMPCMHVLTAETFWRPSHEYIRRFLRTPQSHFDARRGAQGQQSGAGAVCREQHQK